MLFRSTYTPELADEAVLTRADLAVLLHDKAGKPVVNYAMSYADVAEDAAYAEAVRWASSEGLVTGYPEGGFCPEDPVTRQQLAVILYRHAKSLGQGFTGTWAFPLAYTDAKEVSEYAYEAVCWMTVSKVMGADDDNAFAPKGQVTYAEAKEILALYDKATDKTQIPNPFVDCDTMDAAAKISGFSMSLPDKLPSWVEDTAIRASRSMVEVICQGGEDKLTLRKGSGSEDISGDYTKYEENDTLELEGRKVTTKGGDGKVMVATWQEGEYTYAIRSTVGMSHDELSALVSNMK